MKSTEFIRENVERDDDLFADRKSTQLANFFTEKAKTWYELANEYRNSEDDEEYADGVENDAQAFEDVANAFKLGMEAGLEEFRMLDTDPRETVAEELEEALDIDIYALAYNHMNESDDDMFSDRKRLPPKNLNALLHWAGNNPENKYFTDREKTFLAPVDAKMQNEMNQNRKSMTDFKDPKTGLNLFSQEDLDKTFIIDD